MISDDESKREIYMNHEDLGEGPKKVSFFCSSMIVNKTSLPLLFFHKNDGNQYLLPGQMPIPNLDEEIGKYIKNLFQLYLIWATHIY